MSALSRVRRGILLALLLFMVLFSVGATVGARPHALEPLTIECAAPADGSQIIACAAFEQAVLDATILIRTVSRCVDRPEAKLWWFDSHATILDERTILTHSHYRILGDERCVLQEVILYAPDGSLIATIVDPQELAEVTRQLIPGRGGCARQACILSLGRVYFTSVSGVHRVSLDPVALAGQMVTWPAVAEVNWRGSPGTTYVQWTRVRAVSERVGVPVLELADGILKGASGGGVWAPTTDGLVHIGNGWCTRVDGLGSVMALNP